MEKIILYGVAVYTSDELKEQLKTMIQVKGSSSTKQALIDLVDNGSLVPVINEPSKLRQLIMKIRKKKPVYNLGSTWKGKSYVIFHEGQSSKVTIDTALHEVVHLAHRQFPEKFTSINKKIYIEYYTYFYKQLFKADDYNKKEFASFLNNLFFHETYYANILYNAFKDHSKLTKKGMDDRIDLIFKIWDASDAGKYYTLPSNDVFMLLRKTYRVLFKKVDYQSGLGQELWNPAEIICILSTINPEHPNVIKSLKLIKPGKKPVIKLAKKLIR